MRTYVVVPDPKQVEVPLGFASVESPLAAELLEGLEESLDAPVLPGCERSRALMADAEQAECELEERRGKDGLIVGTNASGLTEEIDRVQDGANDRDGGLVPQVGQHQTSTGTVIEQTEDGALAVTFADVSEVERLDDVWRHRLRPPVLELAANRGQLVLALPQHSGDEGLADSHVSSMLVQVVEDDGDLSASMERHQGFEAQDFLVDPWRFGRGAGACRRRRCLDQPPPYRSRTMTRSTLLEGQRGCEADQEKQDL